MGIGGLGHLAIQIANAWGCKVVVFSSGESKREEAKKLGAHECYTAKDLAEKKVATKINYLIVTTSGLPDWTP